MSFTISIDSDSPKHSPPIMIPSTRSSKYNGHKVYKGTPSSGSEISIVRELDQSSDSSKEASPTGSRDSSPERSREDGSPPESDIYMRQPVNLFSGQGGHNVTLSVAQKAGVLQLASKTTQLVKHQNPQYLYLFGAIMEADQKFSLTHVQDRREDIEMQLVQSWYSGHVATSYETATRHSIMLLDSRAKEVQEFTTEQSLFRNEEVTGKIFNAIKRNKRRDARLQFFVQSMPKSGDLHLHVGGTIPKQTLLNFASEAGLFVEIIGKRMGLFYKEGEEPKKISDKKVTRISAKELTSNFAYNDIVNDFKSRCSMKGVERASRKGGDHFFKSFDIPESIMNHMPLEEQIKSIVEYAFTLKILYASPMIELLNQDPPECFSKFEMSFGKDNFEEAIRMLRGSWLDDYVSNWSKKLQKCNREVAKWLREYITENLKNFNASTEEISKHLDESIPSLEHPSSPVVIRYIVEVMRTLKPHQFFASIAAAMALSQQFPEIVAGITIDGPEESQVAMVNFSLQKEIIKFLHPIFGSPNLTLHGGEWEISDTENARKRIRDCIDLKAKCIGHATSILTEHEPGVTLKKMLDADVLVEICMRSSLEILGKHPSDHPIVNYWEAGVPIALGSDDPAVNNSSLTNDIMDAISAVDWGYKDLKNVMRNALAYAFLPGESIFVRKENYYYLKQDFSSLLSSNWVPSQEIEDLISKSPKAQLQIRYEQLLAEFEANIVRIFMKDNKDGESNLLIQA